NGIVICRRVRSDLLKLTNVVVLLFIGCHQGPQALDLGFSNVQKASPMRSQEPLVKAGAVVITVKILMFERKMRERVSAVDYCLDPSVSRHPAYALDRKDLAG